MADNPTGPSFAPPSAAAVGKQELTLLPDDVLTDSRAAPAASSTATASSATSSAATASSRTSSNATFSPGAAGAMSSPAKEVGGDTIDALLGDLEHDDFRAYLERPQVPETSGQRSAAYTSSIAKIPRAPRTTDPPVDAVVLSTSLQMSVDLVPKSPPVPHGVDPDATTQPISKAIADEALRNGPQDARALLVDATSTAAAAPNAESAADAALAEQPLASTEPALPAPSVSILPTPPSTTTPPPSTRDVAGDTMLSVRPPSMAPSTRRAVWVACAAAIGLGGVAAAAYLLREAPAGDGPAASSSHAAPATSTAAPTRAALEGPEPGSSVAASSLGGANGARPPVLLRTPPTLRGARPSSVRPHLLAPTAPGSGITEGKGGSGTNR